MHSNDEVKELWDQARASGSLSQIPHPVPATDEDAVFLQSCDRAISLLAAHKFDEALSVIEVCVEAAAQDPRAMHAQIRSCHIYANCLGGMQRYRDQLAVYHRIDQLYKRAVHEEHPRVVEFLETQSQCLTHIGDVDAALNLQFLAYTIADKYCDMRDSMHMRRLMNLGTSYLDHKQYERARGVFSTAWKQIMELAWEHKDAAKIGFYLALCSDLSDDAREADYLYRRSCDMIDELMDPDFDVDGMTELLNMAMNCERLGQISRARVLYQRLCAYYQELNRPTAFIEDKLSALGH